MKRVDYLCPLDEDRLRLNLKKNEFFYSVFGLYYLCDT